MRRPLLALALVVAAVVPVAVSAAESEAGAVDGALFRTLVDDADEVLEIDLDGPMLQAIAKNKERDEPGETPAKDVFGKLKAVHAIIGTVKDVAGAQNAIRQTEQKLAAQGWKRVTRIKDETSVVSVLTHSTGGQMDGLVAMIFDTEDNEVVFANLVGPIDLESLGDLGDTLNVPGLDQVPGAR